MLKKTALTAKPATCHTDRPLYARSRCRSCYEKLLKKANPAFAERQRKNCRDWGAANAAKKKAADSAWLAKKDPEWRRARYLRRYGLTPERYDAILAGQCGACRICRQRPKSGKALAVDHCHETGRVRGLLCFRCNFGLSFFAEDAQTLFRAARHVWAGRSRRKQL
jgi:hypothetical protein